VLTDSPAFVLASLHHDRVRTRAAAVMVVALLTGSLAGCGPAGAAGGAANRAASGPQPPAVGCSTQPLHPHENGPVRFTAQLGDTTARVTATAVTRNYQQWLTHPQLTLKTGTTSWQAPLKPAPMAFQQHYDPLPVRVAATRQSGYVCLAQFAPGKPSFAVVSVYAGGAHCCTSFRVFDPSTRTATRLDTGNMGAVIATVGDRLLLRTADDRFSYAFAAFAFSGSPVKLLRPTGSGFRNVTKAHPALVRQDADQWWNQFLHPDDSGLGYLAAWAADQERLGHDARVWSTLNRLNDAGRLTEPKNDRSYWPEGAKYVAQLRQFLTKTGYRSPTSMGR
jgi:hypothetical protein